MFIRRIDLVRTHLPGPVRRIASRCGGRAGAPPTARGRRANRRELDDLTPALRRDLGIGPEPRPAPARPFWLLPR